MSSRNSNSSQGGPKRYAIYLRCSTDDQAEGDFTTLDTQRAVTREHVRQNGGVFVKEYSDEGKSGTHLNRPGWKALFKDAEEGKFDMVCVSYLSRLGRGDAGNAAEFLLRSHGIGVEFAKEDFGSGTDGFVRKSVARLVDGMYVENVRAWTKTKMEQMVARGYYCGGTVPFGYRLEAASDAAGFHKGDKEPPKRLVPHADDAPLLRQAFALFGETGSVVAVQEWLRTVTPRPWSYDTVKRVLSSPVYRGVLQFGQWVNHTSHEALVSESTWDAAQTLLQDKSRPRRPKQNPKDTAPYYLRGLVFCPHCDCRMTPADHHGRAATVRYYECTHTHKGKTKGCPVVRVNADSLHEAVLSEVRRAVEHPTRMTEIIREAVKALPEPQNEKETLKAVTRRLRETDKQIARLTEVVANSTTKTPMRPLLARLEALEQERASVEAERERVERALAASEIRRPDAAQVQRLWGRVTELWEEATEAERIELMGLLVERVDMQQKERGNCRLLFAATFPRSVVGLTSRLGAGVGFEPTTFGL